MDVAKMTIKELMEEKKKIDAAAKIIRDELRRRIQR